MMSWVYNLELILKLSSNLLEIPNHALYATLSDSDWLFISQPRVLHADWMWLYDNEKATLHINLLSYYLDISTNNQQPSNNNGLHTMQCARLTFHCSALGPKTCQYSLQNSRSSSWLFIVLTPTALTQLTNQALGHQIDVYFELPAACFCTLSALWCCWRPIFQW